MVFSILKNCFPLMTANVIPLIDICVNAMQQIEERDVGLQVEYLLLRNYYASVVNHYANLPADDAARYDRMVHRELKRQLPSYRRNPYLWPFGNGYEFKGSCACYIMLWLERLGLISLLGVGSRLLRKSKMVRK